MADLERPAQARTGLACVRRCSGLRSHRVAIRTNDLPLGRELLRHLVAENYPAIARSLLQPLLYLFSISRRACGGDADKFLIMLVIAIRTTEHELFATYSQAQLLSGEVPVFPTLGTNVRSIAESTGAPRETVRRKVRQLVDAGWVSRRGNELRFTALAYQQLADVRVAIEHLAVQNFQVVADLARQSCEGSSDD